MPEEFRIYSLVRITGWTLDEINDAPADLCDWLLRIDVTIAEVRAEAKRIGGG